MVATGLTAASTLGGIGFGHKLFSDARAEARADRTKQREELHAELTASADRFALSTRREFDSKWDTCQGTEGGLACTFTNAAATGADIVCVRATVSSKESSGIKLTSMPLCSGRIAPGTTVDVRVDWNRGRPSDICNSPGSFGKQLDWSKCSMDIDDLPAAPTPP